MNPTCLVAAHLLALCLPLLACGGEIVAGNGATREQTEQAVNRAVGYLQAESGTWLKIRCAACHHAGMPLWALADADRRGYAIDRDYLARKIESILGSTEAMIGKGLVANPAQPPDTRPMARGVNLGQVFMAVAARSMTSLTDGQAQSVKFIESEVINKQQPDGSWEFFLSRPPINESKATDVAWMLMALEDGARSHPSDSYRAAIERGSAWLDGAEPDNRQAKVLGLLVAVRAGKTRGTIQARIDEILAFQRPDGGWGQLADSESDAFATGQVLYVLTQAGLTAERPEIKRAVGFLVKTQNPDGSWPMKSRSTPDGSPGSAKLLTPITCAASSWATLGLVNVAPKKN